MLLTNWYNADNAFFMILKLRSNQVYFYIHQYCDINILSSTIANMCIVVEAAERQNNSSV